MHNLLSAIILIDNRSCLKRQRRTDFHAYVEANFQTMLAARVVHPIIPRRVMKVDAEVLNAALVKNKQHFNGFDLQKRAYYNLRDDIHQYVKTCANNVRLIIYVDDVLDQPIKISAGKTENELCITIKIDGTLKVKWTKETCSYEAKIEEVNGKALDDVFKRYMHRFTGIEPQRQAFNKVRDIILDLGTTFADNVKIVIYVIDVFDQPIVISTRMTDNELSITINIDGTLKVKWEKETCSYKENITEVNVEALEDAFQTYMHRFVHIEPQRQAFYHVRDMIHDLVKFCVDNVKIVISVDDVLKKSIIISTEKTENELHFTIKTDGIVTKSWTKKTWMKCLCENWESASVVVKETTEIIRNVGLLLTEFRKLLPKMKSSSCESRE